MVCGVLCAGLQGMGKECRDARTSMVRASIRNDCTGDAACVPQWGDLKQARRAIAMRIHVEQRSVLAQCQFFRSVDTHSPAVPNHERISPRRRPKLTPVKVCKAREVTMRPRSHDLTTRPRNRRQGAAPRPQCPGQFH